jgi:hypothetical protein
MISRRSSRFSSICFTDREIIQLPGGAALQPWVARLIAKMRGPSVRQ